MSEGRTETSERGPKLKLEHPEIQSRSVEGEKKGEKGTKLGEKRGILAVLKQLQQRQFRNSCAEVGHKQLHL